MADFEALKLFVFGPDPPDDVVARWKQGFVFASDPAFALVQHQGGPCAVLAPVQAHVMDMLLYGGRDADAASPGWDAPSEEARDEALIAAMANIIARATSGDRGPTIVLEEGHFPHATMADLHANLTALEELEMLLRASMDQFRAANGILLFMYSVLLSRGLAQVQADGGEGDEDAGQPLIQTFGHASQSLVNLMLTGHAVAHVWDGDQDLGGGMLLRGVPEQPAIGYLTVLEALHYCEVGSLLKSPRRPLWVVASETHFTVVFSDMPALACPEPSHLKAKRIFLKHDREGNGFIMAAAADAVLREVGIADSDVPAMKKRLDPENGGVILMTDFLNVAAKSNPNERTARIPTEFPLYHVNNLVRSTAGPAPQFRKGKAVYTGSGDTGGHDLLACLRTKYRGLEVSWEGSPPSMN